MKRFWLAAIAASLSLLSYVTTAPAHAAAGTGIATTIPAAQRAGATSVQTVHYRRYRHRHHYRPRVYYYVKPRYYYRRHHRHYRPYRYHYRPYVRRHYRRW